MGFLADNDATISPTSAASGSSFSLSANDAATPLNRQSAQEALQIGSAPAPTVYKPIISKPVQAPKPSSIFDKIGNVAKNIAVGTVKQIARGGTGVVNLVDLGLSKIPGYVPNKGTSKSTFSQAQAELPKAASSFVGQQTPASAVGDIAQTALYGVPASGIVKGSTLLARVAGNAAISGGLGFGASAASQKLTTGKVNLKQAAEQGAGMAAFGAVGGIKDVRASDVPNLTPEARKAATKAITTGILPELQPLAEQAKTFPDAPSFVKALTDNNSALLNAEEPPHPDLLKAQSGIDEFEANNPGQALDANDFYQRAVGVKDNLTTATPLSTLDKVNALPNENAPVAETPKPTSEAKPETALPDYLQEEVKRGNVSPNVEQANVKDLKPGTDSLGTGELDNKTVAQYKEDIANNKTLDPLIVSEKNGQSFVQDGAHRLQAAKESGMEQVSVVKQITKSEAKPTETSNVQPLIDHAYKFKTAKGFMQNPKTSQILDQLSNPEKLEQNQLSAHADVLDRAGAKSLADLHAQSQEPRLVSIDTKAVETPEIKTSKLASGVEAKAIQAKLTQGFEGLPEYAKVNIPDQVKAAVDLVKNDPERAIRIAHGDEIPPEGLLPESVFTAVENSALKNKDIDLLQSLATRSSLPGEATGMGQRIRMLGERNPSSAVSAIKQISDARKAAFEKGGVTADKAITSTATDIKKAIKPPTKYDWASFVEGIKC